MRWRGEKTGEKKIKSQTDKTTLRQNEAEKLVGGADKGKLCERYTLSERYTLPEPKLQPLSALRATGGGGLGDSEELQPAAVQDSSQPLSSLGELGLRQFSV